MSAIDHVDVVSDGASAIYGSDAVGGVVNFVLRRDFDGAETRVRYGDTADGGNSKLQAAQTLGKVWEGGSGLISYEYLDQRPLLASDRSYTSGAAEPFDIIPPQLRHGAFGSLHQAFADRYDFYAEALYSHRSTSANIAFNGPGGSPFSTSDTATTIDEAGGTVGLSIQLPRDTVLDLSTSHTRNTIHKDVLFEVFNVFPYTPALKMDYTTSVLSFDPKLDGKLLDVPAGPVRYAVGGQYRAETYDAIDRLGSSTYISPKRKVYAGYAELAIPIIGPASNDTAHNVVELSIAGRAEHYSDFGTTFNPKIGAVWRPLPSFKVRASFGTSFKAPLLVQLDPALTEVASAALVNPGGAGSTIGLVESGGNANLGPEKARTWTAGIDWAPTSERGPTASLTYYYIRYADRIATVDSAISNNANYLLFEQQLGPGIVQRNPPLSLVTELVNSPVFFNTVPGFQPSQVQVLIDDRYLNIASVTTSGVDFSIDDRLPTRLGAFDAGIVGEYIIDFDHRFVAGAAPVSFLNTSYNPVDVKARAHVSLQSGLLTYTLFGNYTAPYKNTNLVPSAHVSSWTTLDGVIQLDLANGYGWADGTTLLLSVLNVTNRAPPFVQNSNATLGINYDGANANAVGRSVSLQLSKRW